MTKSRPILLGNAVLASLQVLTAAGGLSEVIGPKIFFLFGILVAAAQVGFNVYAQGLIVPVQDVASYINSEGVAVSGPAGPGTTGSEVQVAEVNPPVMKKITEHPPL